MLIFYLKVFREKQEAQGLRQQHVHYDDNTELMSMAPVPGFSYILCKTQFLK